MFALARQPSDEPANPSRSLKELLGSPRLQEMWQFSFVVNSEWLHAKLPGVKTHVVYGYQNVDIMEKVPQITYHAAKLHSRWSCHHTKMMILFFDNTVQIVIHTANLRQFDWSFMTQGMWVSPELPRQQNKLSRFRINLTNYLCAYGLDSLRDLAIRLKDYDFSAVKDHFIGTVPGNSLNWGLEQISPKLPKTDVVVCQCSSIATLPDSYLKFMRTKFNTKHLKIVYPTVDQVRNTVGGYASGQCLFLRKYDHNKENFQRIKPLLCEWISEKASRQFYAPHIKTYTGFIGDKVAWVCWTSANMSQGAWGTPAQQKKLNYKNFEAGVLRVFDEPQPVAYVSDNKDWMLCYDWPLTPMASEAWSQDGFYREKDIHGEVWPQ